MPNVHIHTNRTHVGQPPDESLRRMFLEHTFSCPISATFHEADDTKVVLNFGRSKRGPKVTRNRDKITTCLLEHCSLENAQSASINLGI